MSQTLQLIATAIFPIIVSAILYLLEKKTGFGRLAKKNRIVIIGIVFGGLAVLGTEFGINVNGAVINVRDASVLTAGLVFGAPCGIIAGIIGSVERYLAVFWGAGSYTQLACTISTFLAGIIGAVLRQHMFDDKIPSWQYALGIGITTEILHMLMVFVTNMNDIQTAFSFVEICATPMILANGLSVMGAVIVVSLLSGEGRKKKHYDRQITVQFQRGLLICISVALLVTVSFTLFLQNSVFQNDTDNLLSLNLKDVKADITNASDKNLLRLTDQIAQQLNRVDVASSDDLNRVWQDYPNVAEINVVNSKGIILYSTNDRFVGYDMNSGEQSRSFLVLLSGTESLVQSYQPISYDESISRKYAGKQLKSGGFVQVGYDAEAFQADLAESIAGITQNRHIGKNGCIIIVDKSLQIVSDNNGYTGDIFDLTNIPKDIDERQRFTMSVFGVSSYCMYEMNEGYYVLAVLPVAEATFSRNISVYIMLFMEVLVFVCLFILIYFLIKQLVVDNIRKVNDSLSRITSGDLNVKVDVRDNQEFASLSDDINSTVVTLKRYIAEASARIEQELNFAKTIQHSALPSVFPPFPTRDDFDIFASMDAAKEVGGDFYDFYFTGPNTLFLVIADVSGKGIPAAMFMMQAKTLIKGYAESGLSADSVLTSANRKLCDGNDAEMFVTAWVGRMDLTTGILQFANAGHNPPLVRRGDGNYEYLPSRPGLVLAGMNDITYKSSTIQLQAGDSLFLYTDGVTEASNKDLQLFGEDRLQKVLNENLTVSATATCAAVKQSIGVFVGEAEQFDDITMLCFRYGSTTAEMTVLATVANIESVTNFVNERLQKANCPQKTQNQIDMAIDELFSNIANYAYQPKTGAATVCVEVQPKPLAVIITFIDNGVPFDPLAQPDPDTTSPVSRRQQGGLGIYMVKKTMDDISYEYKDGHNILRIKKNI